VCSLAILFRRFHWSGRIQPVVYLAKPYMWLLVSVALKKSMTTSLPNGPLAGYGVKERAKRAALLALEGAGLIQVEWKPGCNPIVTIKMDEDCAPAHH
jgi:hypothetical protein